METLNVADVLDDDTVTEAGTVAAALSEAIVTASPDGPAGPFSVTVPVDGLPPATVVGFKLNDEIVAGWMVSVPV